MCLGKDTHSLFESLLSCLVEDVPAFGTLVVLLACLQIFASFHCVINMFLRGFCDCQFCEQSSVMIVVQLPQVPCLVQLCDCVVILLYVKNLFYAFFAKVSMCKSFSSVSL